MRTTIDLDNRIYDIELEAKFRYDIVHKTYYIENNDRLEEIRVTYTEIRYYLNDEYIIYNVISQYHRVTDELLLQDINVFNSFKYDMLLRQNVTFDILDEVEHMSLDILIDFILENIVASADTSRELYEIIERDNM